MRLKKITSLLLVALLAGGTLTVAAEESVETVQTTMTVDETSVIKPSDRRMLGINDGWWGSQAVKANSTDINPEFIETFKENGVKIALSRMAGSESQRFYWKKSIGEIEDRGYYGEGTSGSMVNHGIIEWIKYTREIDKDAQFDYVINLNDTPENNADLVRFLCLDPSDPKAIGSDGTNWAQKRVDLGLKDPVVPIIEMGNEYDYITYNSNEEVLARADKYIALCDANMAAMQAVKPDLKFAALMYTVPHDGKGYAVVWNEKIIAYYGPKCDYLSFHYYYHGGSDAVLTKYRMPEITNYINRLPAAQRPKILFTEHAVWTSFESHTDEHRAAVAAFNGTLKTAQVINQTTSEKYTAGMMYHGMGGGTQSMDSHGLWHVIVKHSEDGKFYISGIGELFRLYDYAYGTGAEGENVVSLSLSGNNYVKLDAAGKLTATAHTTADGGLNIVMVNNEASTVGHNITFSAKNDYKLEKEYILKADDLMADNNPATPEGLTTRVNLKNSENKFTSYYIPPKCAVVLKLVPMDKTYGETKQVELNLDYASKNDDGTVYIHSTDRKLEFDAQFYANKWAAPAESATLTVFKPGYNLENFETNQGDAVAYIDTKNVFKDRIYFKVMMPEDCEQGVYTAVLSTQVNGNTINETIEFEYIPDLVSKFVNNVSVSGSYVDGIVEVSNQDYSFDCRVSMNTLFPERKDYKITVSSLANEEIVYTNTVTHGNKNIDIFNIKMPKDAVEGIYKVTVECGSDVANAETLFSFKKPTEKIILSDIIKTNGEKLTLENIAAAEAFEFNATNVTNADITALVVAAAYDKNGGLVASASAQHLFKTGEETPVNVPMSISGNINTVKVYVWDNTSVTPCTEVYNIK